MHPRRFSIPALAAVALLSMALVAPASARKRGGGDGIAPSEQEQAVHQLRQQIAAEELAVALNLSKDQRRALATVVADAVAQREAHRAERATKAGEVQEILEDYLAEVQRDGAVSEATAQSLRTFRADNRPDPEARRAARKDTKASLQEILSEEQQQTLRDFRPMSAAGPTDEERAERRSERSERVRGNLEERGFDADDMEAMHEMKEQRGERKHTRRVVRDVLFSPAFLNALSR